MADRVCSACGALLPAESAFCTTCGAPLAGQAPAQPRAADPGSPVAVQGATPAQYLWQAIKTIPSAFATILKNLRLLKPAMAFTGLWIILGILPIIGVHILPVRILSVLTFAQGGLFTGGFYGAVGILGGTLGRVIYAYLIMPLLQGQRPFAGVGAGLKHLPANIKLDTRSLVLLCAGGAMALFVFNLVTGNASLANIMPVIAALILSLRALGRPIGFLRGFILSLVQTYGRGADPDQATRRILAGIACGFALAIPLSLTGWRMVGYVAGLICLVAAVAVKLWPRKQLGSLMILAALACSAWPVWAGPGTSPAQQETPGVGVIEVAETGMRLNYSISGGQITGEPTTEGAGYRGVRLSMVGTVRPGETLHIELSASGTNWAAINTNNADGNSTFMASISDDAGHTDRQDFTLAPGTSGSASATLVVPEDARTVEVSGLISSVWFNPNGGGSSSLIVQVVYQVEQPTPLPVAAAAEETAPPAQPDPDPDAGTAAETAAPASSADEPDALIGADVIAALGLAIAVSIIAALAALLPLAATLGPQAQGAVAQAAGSPPQAPVSAGSGQGVRTDPVDVVDGAWAASGETAERLLKALERHNLEGMNKSWQEIFRHGRTETSAQLKQASRRILQSMNRLKQDFGRARTVGRTIGRALSVVSVGIDTYENMQSHHREDGTVLSGDGFLTASGKSILANAIVTKMLTHYPVIAAAELANYVTIGNTQAGGITSPVTNMKGVINMGADWANSRELAIERAEAGVYGENLKNALSGAQIAEEAYDDPWRFIQDVGHAGSDDPFFQNMQRTASTMWRNEDGTIGYVGAAGEATSQMTIAIAQTASGMARCAGYLAGAAYERAGYVWRSFFA